MEDKKGPQNAEKELTDLEKYQKELVNVNSQLSQLDNKRADLVRIGVRVEGIVAYLQDKKNREDAAKAEALKEKDPAKKEEAKKEKAPESVKLT